MMFKCKNCKWEGDNPVEPYHNCPICGDGTNPIAIASTPKNEFDEMDLNKDGKVDIKDKTLAGKVLSKKIKR